MAKNKTPSQLRADAQALLEKAKKEENKMYENVGRLVEKHLKEGFRKFELSAFKNQVKEMLQI